MEPTDAIADYAERPRVGGWSLRSALVRYAQPEPGRAGAVLEMIRRVDGALKQHRRLLEHDPELNHVARTVYQQRAGRPIDGVGDEEAGRALDVDERSAVALLAVASGLDELGGLLAGWATGIDRPRPDADVDRLGRQVFTSLSELGVARETRPPRRS